jgi:hypothetical protein
MLSALSALVIGVSWGRAAASGPGTHSQAAVDQAIARGVAFLRKQQNLDGSFGTSFPVAETGLALAAYDVADAGDVSQLSAPLRGSLLAGLHYLLSQQMSDGEFATDGYPTYSTGLVLTALGLMGSVPGENAAIARTIARGRAFLLSEQQAPPSITHNSSSPVCQTSGAIGTGKGGQDYCGGWNYDPGTGRSDESNTGFALTGLNFTGGVPAAQAAFNLGWQRNVEEFRGNPFATRFDGGGDYQPGASGIESSNANDVGSLVFGDAFDGAAATDPGVPQAIAFAHAVLSEYERVKNVSPRVMIYHTATGPTPSCTIGPSSCAWSFASGEGGYHYSLFAISKGLGHYESPSLTDPNNFYAQIVDLLLTEQGKDGSWPADLRDDASTVGATAFALLALGKVGASAPPPVLGESADVKPVSGIVMVRLPHAKGQGFVPLTAASQLPVGSQVDARAGTLQLTAATGSRHTTQIATLAGAVFSLSQTAKGSEKGLTTFALVEGGFRGAPSFRSCGAHAAPDGSSPGARAASVSPKVIQTLHARDRHGHFGTRGRHSSATVRGTVWDTVERCDGTLTVVKRGTVRVFDFRRKVTITVHAGKRYLAKAT